MDEELKDQKILKSKVKNILKELQEEGSLSLPKDKSPRKNLLYLPKNVLLTKMIITSVRKDIG